MCAVTGRRNEEDLTGSSPPTHLVNALGSPAVMRTRARIVRHAGVDVCRLDVGRSTRPVPVKTSKLPDVFFVRMNNSSRALVEEECHDYIAHHWSPATPLGGLPRKTS